MSALDDISDEEVERATGQSRAMENLVVMRGIDPERAAEARRNPMGGFLGPGYDPAQAAAARNYRRDELLVSTSPQLQRWLSDGRNASVAHDDVPALSFWERLSAAWNQGERNIEMSRLSNRDNPETWRSSYDAGALTLDDRERLKELRRTAQFETDNWLEDVTMQLPQIFGSVDAGNRRAVRGVRETWRQVYGSEPQPMTVSNAAYAALLLPLAVTGSAMAGGGGFLGGYTGFTYEQEAGAAFEEFRFLRDANGQQIDPMVAGRYARQVGEINMAIEMLGLGVVGKGLKFAGGTELLERITSSGVRSALRRIGYREVAQNFARNVGGTALAEGFTELSQEGVTVFLGELARGMSNEEALAHLSDEEVASRLWEAWRVGATVGGALGAVPASINAGIDLHDIHRTRAQAELFDAIEEGVTASKLQQRSPSAFAEAVQAMVQGGPIEEVRIQARRFAEVFEQNDEDAFAAADKLQGVGAQALRDALANGGDISIPMGTFASQIVGTEAGRKLAFHARMGPDQLTPAEVQARIALGVDLAKAATEASRLEREAEAADARRAQNEQDAQSIFERFRDMMRGSQTFANASTVDDDIATLFASGMVAQAERGGISPKELFDDLGVEVVGPFGHVADDGVLAFDQDGAPDYAEMQRRIDAMWERLRELDARIDGTNKTIAGMREEAIAARDSLREKAKRAEELIARIQDVGLDQRDKRGPRGQIQFGRDESGYVNRARVFFHEARNASTPIHELMGHLFLESLRIVASKETASEQAKRDWQTILDWFGVTNEQWTAWSKLPTNEGVAALRPFHEKFARGVEVYFKEGKTPSLELRDIFARFKNWMLFVYQKAGGRIPGAPELNDQIREVFDRMLATDEQIARARAQQGGAAPMSREEFGAVGNKFADKQYARYVQQWERARNDARAAIDAEIVKVIYAEHQREWRRTAARARRTIIAEMEQDPLWIAHDWLTGLKVPAGENALQMNTAEAVAAYGAELINQLPAGVVMTETADLVVQAQWAAKMLKERPPLRLHERVRQLQVIDPDGSLTGTKRTEGRSLADAAEMLWDEGFFGPKPSGFMQNDDFEAISDAEHALSIIDMIYGETDITAVGGVNNIVKFLDDRSSAAIRSMGIEEGTLDISNAEHQQIISRILAHEAYAHTQLAAGTASEWYDQTIQLLMQLASIKHPELESDPIARMAFTLAIAVTSQKQNVVDNLMYAESRYAAYMKSAATHADRRFPEEGTGKAAPSMAENFAKINRMIAAWGPDVTRRFLATTFSPGELAAAGFSKGNMPIDYSVTGSYVLGSKIGWGFYSNLNGNFEPVTIDMWLMRTIGRLTGKVSAFDNELLVEQLDELRRLARQRVAKKNRDPGIYADDIEGFDKARLDDQEYALEFAEAVLRTHEREYNQLGKEAYDRMRIKTPLVRVAERIFVNRTGAREQPKSGAERANIAEVINLAVAKFEALSGRRAPPASLQAIVWYPEQELYKALGAKLRETSVDYAEAMRRMLAREGYDVDEELQARQLRERARAGSGAGERGDAGGADPRAAGNVKAADTLEARERGALLRGRGVRVIRWANRDADASPSRPYERRSDQSVRKVRGLIPEAIEVWSAKRAFSGRAQKVGGSAPTFIELDPQTGAERFHAAIAAAKADNAHGAAVTLYDVDAYRETRLFMTEDASAGFALKPDGDIVSVFKNPHITGSPAATFGLMQLAVQEGGKKLDAFDTVLPELYEPHGFIVVKRMRFADEYAPDGWDYEAFGRFNGGRPDVVFMVYDPNWYGRVEHYPADYTEDYDAAVAAQEAALARIAEGQSAAADVPANRWGDAAFFQDDEAEELSPLPVAPRSAVALNAMSDADLLDWFNNSGDVRLGFTRDGDPVVHFKTNPALKTHDARVVFEERGDGAYEGVTFLRGRVARDGYNWKPSKAQVAKAHHLFIRLAAVTRAWIILNKPDKIVFTGAEPQHERLYRTMLRLIDLGGYNAREEKFVNTSIRIGSARAQPEPDQASRVSTMVNFVLIRQDVAIDTPLKDVPPTAYRRTFTSQSAPATLLDWAESRSTQLRNPVDAQIVRRLERTDDLYGIDPGGAGTRAIDVGLSERARSTKLAALDAFDRDAGFAQDQEDEITPQAEELLERLKDDLGGRPVYRFGDEEAAANYHEAERVRDWFADQGVDITAKKADLEAAIRKAAAALNESGIDPDTVASIINGYLGQRVFDSGHDLLRNIASMPKRHEYIRAEVEKRTRAELGDPAESDLADRARIATHSHSAEQVIEMELDAMSRATGGGSRPVSRVAKQIAERQIGLTSVKQVRKADWYLGNERRHARAAMEAHARGDAAAAQKSKYHQLVNFHLFALAKKAAKEVDRAQAYFQRIQKLAARAAIAPDYMEQIDQLLEQYELRKISGAEHQRRLSLAAWARSMEERGLGHMVQIDPAILERANRIPFDQLNVNDVRALVDAIKNIEHLGRLKDKLMDAADQRRVSEVVAENVTRLRATGALSQQKRKSYSPSPFERAADGMREAHAQMTRMEFLFRYLDGQFNGPLWRSLWLPFARAADKESAMQNQFARKQRAIWERYARAERARMFKTRYTIAGLPIIGATGTATSYTRAELISIALNLGNAGNVAALVDGFGWGKSPQGIDTDYDAAKQLIIDQLDTVLTAKDWQTVQQLWTLIGEYRDEAFQLQQDMTGIRPEAVEASALKTRFGELAGGYYPLKFDAKRDLRVAKAEAKEEVQALYGSNWTAPMTRKGHLINRVGSGGRPVKLSLTVYTEHVQNVVHDIAYRRAIVDVNRIISSKDFADAFIDVAGRAAYDQLPLWLQEIASDKVDPSSFMWKFMQKMRGNAAIAAMGFKISTALQQLTGVLNAVPMVGGPEMTAALAKLFSRPDLLPQKAKFILNRSEFMRSRVQTYDRDAREAIERMERDDALYPIRQNAFMMVGMFDWAVSSVVWTAGFDKARGGKVKGIDPTDEEASVRYADSLVRQTQSAGLAQDLPAIMRGNQVNKLLTMFFSFFSVLYNWTSYDQVMNLRKGRLPPHVFIGNMVLIFVIAPLIAEALAGRWEPRGDEDDEDRNARLMAVIAKYPFMMIPVVRDIANAVGSTFEYQLSPTESGVGKIVEAVNDAAEGRTFESEATTKRAVVAAGYAFGLPTPQAWIMGDYLVDKIEGEEEGFDPMEALVRDTR